ncbi:MAG: hypothetical protein B7Z08_06630 [Sphingomonadales bacterium 32-68-7]|nr:MAG: hypothetical protein B7Z33_05915 [Sphingomonadales bacterium 12-68-11]OYX09121.1 MAG: hypothetical protein B7Z08_06630 [Sphingomonadales bacterium 32-68-7]
MAAPARSHALARSPWVERLCHWLESAWRAGICSRPSLDPEALWARACLTVSPAGETGGRDVEDVADFRQRLERLCGALEGEAALNPLGRTMAHGQLVRVIRQRLRLGALWRKRPDLLETRLAPPILVVGQMRAGTTRVHRLLAADPAHAATRFCDSWYPLPETPDFRPVWAIGTLAFARLLDPWLDTIHPFGTARADEELGWLAEALSPCAYEAQWRVPSFVAWSEARDPLPVYREFARLLATDAAHRGNSHKPRVLKVPQFAEDLPALLTLFPQARVVVARRGPEQVSASAVSLVANQMAIQSDQADLAWIKAECARKVALRERRMNAAVANWPGAAAGVEYNALDRDWLSAIAGIYRELELDLTPAALAAMRVEQGRASRSRHTAHSQAYGGFART